MSGGPVTDTARAASMLAEAGRIVAFTGAGLSAESGIPTFAATEDSYTVASRIHDMPLRIQPTDGDKIAAVHRLVSRGVDVDAIIGSL